MTTSRAIATSVWIAVLASALLSAFSAPNFPHPVPAPFFLLPILLFPMAAFFIGGYPFDIAPLRVRIDAQYGQGTYAQFIQQLKPMLLFGVSGVAAAAMEFVRLLSANAEVGAFGRPLFVLSSGLGFLIMRPILS